MVEGAWGFIVCDESGGVASAGAGNMGQAHDALMVEATACLRALELADQYSIVLSWRRIQHNWRKPSEHVLEISAPAERFSKLYVSFFFCVLIFRLLSMYLVHVTRLRTRLLT
jgi:hypothetical protein